MYLVVIGWLYVVLLMAVAEATAINGSILGAIVTLLMYGVGPVALVVYLMDAPRRSKAAKAREMAAVAAGAGSAAPDAGGHAPAAAEDALVPSVREET